MVKKPVTDLKIKACLHVEHKLTEWEKRFLKTLNTEKPHISFKQKITVDQIYRERVKGEFTGFSGDDLGYDDVHDFAR